MPNWVHNAFSISGSREEIDHLIQYVNGGEDRPFDFNKVIPMPETLNIHCGSWQEAAMLAYCLFTNDPAICKTVKVFLYDRYHGHQESLDRDAQKAMELRDEWLSGYGSTDLLTRLLDIRAEDVDLLELPADTFAAYVRYGKVYYDNLIQYGYVDWHDWRCEHWGTK